MNSARPHARLRRAAFIGVAAAALVTEGHGLVARAAAASTSPVYIVTFADGASQGARAATRARVEKAGGTVVHRYERSMRGFAAELPAKALAAVRADANVAAVEADSVVVVDSTQADPPAGLDRIDERSRPLDHRFRYSATGRGVDIYVIDSGIRAGHSQFGGRVAPGVSAVGDGRGTADCNGHGTYVSGLAAGRTYGVAKGATIVPVRVLGCDGSGSIAGVIAGIEWVTAHHNGPSVANISAGTHASAALDRAVNASISSGVTYVVAAGNSARSACAESPARVSRAITVGAVTSSDSKASFSNYGSCVDIWAPGVKIKSAWATGDTATRLLSGTSSSTPFVSGAIAAYLQNARNAGPGAVRENLVDWSTKGTLRNLGSGSPNRLLFSKLSSSTSSSNAGGSGGGSAPRVSNVSAKLVTSGRGIGDSTVPVRVWWSASRSGTFTVQRSLDGGAHWSTLRTTTSRGATVDVRPDDQLRFRVRGAASGRTGAWSTTPTMRLRVFQQNAIGFAGGWKLLSSKNKSGGSSRVADGAGDSATFSFTGRRFSWIASRGSERGIANVYIDGRYVKTVNQYAALWHHHRVVYSASLAPGRHTVRIVLTGDHVRGARPDVEVDAFVVLD